MSDKLKEGGKVKNLDNLMPEAGRKSQPPRWTANSVSPTVAT